MDVATFGKIMELALLVLSVVAPVSVFCFVLGHLSPKIRRLERAEEQGNAKITRNLADLEKTMLTFRCQTPMIQKEINDLSRLYLELRRS